MNHWSETSSASICDRTSAISAADHARSSGLRKLMKRRTSGQAARMARIVSDGSEA